MRLGFRMRSGKGRYKLKTSDIARKETYEVQKVKKINNWRRKKMIG